MANFINAFVFFAVICATMLAALAQDCNPEGARCSSDSDCCYSECIGSLCQP
uniref:Venom polypeptide n=1 Tax=Dolopus genitalis TaxID=2488630 RepID=A0A3G5BID5_DOLGE|nr:venom polypeptide [Dolopus genitalis]